MKNYRQQIKWNLTICEQNEKCDKEIETIKNEIPRYKMYNNWNKKIYIRNLWQQPWTSRKKNQWAWKENICSYPVRRAKRINIKK